jgi:hypothetical protein
MLRGTLPETSAIRSMQQSVRMAQSDRAAPTGFASDPDLNHAQIRTLRAFGQVGCGEKR